MEINGSQEYTASVFSKPARLHFRHNIEYHKTNILCPENGDNIFPKNACKLLQDYTVSSTKRPQHLPCRNNILPFLISRPFIPTRLSRCSRQSVPKCRHRKFRRRGITEKKAYNNIPPHFSRCFTRFLEENYTLKMELHDNIKMDLK